MIGAVQEPSAETPVALDEVKAYLRVTQDDDDALLVGLIRTASGACERFLGQVLMVREAEEDVPVSSDWRRLSLTPVAAIEGLASVSDEGEVTALPVTDYAIDIDANGDGWVRVTGGQAGRVRVTYTAGIATGWNGVPEPLRQGIVRLVTHLFVHRDDAEEGAPPAAVAALWRPWRRMRLT